jgi:hypothetical protein
MFLTLRPVGRGGRYAALVNDRMIAEGRTPIFTAARSLIQEGVSPQEPLIVSHEGSEIVAMTTTVGQAARSHRMTLPARSASGAYRVVAKERLSLSRCTPQWPSLKWRFLTTTLHEPIFHRCVPEVGRIYFLSFVDL